MFYHHWSSPLDHSFDIREVLVKQIRLLACSGSICTASFFNVVHRRVDPLHHNLRLAPTGAYCTRCL